MAGAEWSLLAVWQHKIEMHYGTEIEMDDLSVDLTRNAASGAVAVYKLPVVPGDVRISLCHPEGFAAIGTLSKDGVIRRPRYPDRGIRSV